MIYAILRTLSFAFVLFQIFKSSYLKKYIAGELTWLLIGAGSIYLLWHKKTRAHFKISDYYIRNTVFAAIIIFLLIQVFAEYFQ